MRRTVRLALALLFLVALAVVLGGTPAFGAQPGPEGAPGAASHEGGHEKGLLIAPTWEWVQQSLPAMIAAFLVFGVVYAVLKAKAWPLINQGLAARADKIRSEIEAAEMAQKQAKAALEQYEKNLAEARAEAQKMLDTAKSQQQALAAELKAKAEAELAMMRDRVRRDIESAKKAALSEIYNETANLATAVARKILQREIGPRDQQRLVDESLGEMKGIGRN